MSTFENPNDKLDFSAVSYKIPYLFHVISVLCSLYTFRAILKQKVAVRGFVKRILIFMQLWNLVVQASYIFLYQFYFPANLNAEGVYRGFSVVWIIVNSLMFLILFVNLLILELFRPLNENISSKKIWFRQRVACGLYVLCHIIPFLRAVLSTEMMGTELFLQLEEKICTVFVLGCVVYDNSQVVYLIILITKFHKQQKATKKEIVTTKLKRAVLVYGLVVSIDWITILLFLSQMTIFYKTVGAFAVQETAGAIVGVHSALLVMVFQNLKNLTFPEPRRQPAIPLPTNPNTRQMESQIPKTGQLNETVNPE